MGEFIQSTMDYIYVLSSSESEKKDREAIVAGKKESVAFVGSSMNSNEAVTNPGTNPKLKKNKTSY